MRRERLVERPSHVTNARPTVTQVFAEASRNHVPDGRRYGTEIGFLFDHGGEHIRAGMASKGPACPSASRTRRPRKPIYRCACPSTSHAPAPARRTPPFRGSFRRRVRGKGSAASLACMPSRLRSFANPKSRTLTVPSGVIFMFAGLRSR